MSGTPGGILGLLIAIIFNPINWFVWTIKIQGALNRYWESKVALR